MVLIALIFVAILILFILYSAFVFHDEAISPHFLNLNSGAAPPIGGGKLSGAAPLIGAGKGRGKRREKLWIAPNLVAIIIFLLFHFAFVFHDEAISAHFLNLNSGAAPPKFQSRFSSLGR
jgi:multisubunit Na+/H+ antiporter MnhB subunit